jgi:hypothetical protein
MRLEERKQMKTGYSASVVIPLLGCLLTACSTLPLDPSVSVNDACDQAMEALAIAAPTDDEAGNAALEFTMSACPTVDEFVAAAIRYPDAVGFTNASGDEVLSFIAIACIYFPKSATCSDAEKSGVLK